MSEYTSITTDMRMLMGCFTGFTEFERDKFERLCDAIDAIHANLERENESLRRELDRVMGEQDHDGWVELPKDADGEVIHVGDMMETERFGVVEVEGFIHNAIAFYVYDPQPARICTVPANQCRHYHAPTVEDVMGEHEDRYQEGYREGIMDGCAHYDAEHTECLLSEPHGWVELPKDADGEIIHVGDEMERGKSRGHVIALMLSEYPKKWGGGLHWGVQLEGEQAPTALDAFFHHYHEPTVEDMLEEFVARWMETHPDDIPALKAEYAAKLRLAGE